MIRKYLANRRMKKFLTLLPRTLFQDYGRKSEYTKGQVETAAKKLGYNNPELLKIAVAIYCNAKVAEAFGIDDALVKKYRGYPARHEVDWVVGGGRGGLSGGHDGGGSD